MTYTKNAFKFLLVGKSAANIGDVLFIIALMPLIYEETGSTFLMALVPFLITGSRFISAFLAPLLFKRLTLKKIMVWAQSIKTVLLFCLVLYLFFLFNNVLPVYAFISVIGLLDGTSSPASSALVPKIVSKEKLLKSNSWLESTSQFIEIAMWPLGAMLVAFSSSNMGMVISTILYLFSTVCYLCIKASLKIDKEASKRSASDFKDEVKKGWLFILRRKDIFCITITGILISSANIVWIASILLVYVEEVLNTGSVWWGYINSLLVFGLFLAGVLSIVFSKKTEKQFRRMLILSTLIMAISTLVLSINSFPIVAVICAFVYGFTNQLKALLEVTYLQINIDEDNLPYVYAAQEAAYLLTFAISVLLFSSIADIFGVVLVFALAGALLLIGFVFLIVFRENLLELGSSGDYN